MKYLIILLFLSSPAFAAFLGDPVNVVTGGTQVTTLTNHGVMLGQGTSPIHVTAAGANNTLLHGNSGADPTYSAVSLTADVSGVLPYANGGAGTPTQETPSGTVNGSNTTFTLAHTPASNANVLLYLDGLFQRQGGGNDYTISGTTITFVTAPATNQTIDADYVF